MINWASDKYKLDGAVSSDIFEETIKSITLKWIEWKSFLVSLTKPLVDSFTYIFAGRKPKYDLPYSVTVQHSILNTWLLTLLCKI